MSADHDLTFAAAEGWDATVTRFASIPVRLIIRATATVVVTPDAANAAKDALRGC